MCQRRQGACASQVHETVTSSSVSSNIQMARDAVKPPLAVLWRVRRATGENGKDARARTIGGETGLAQDYSPRRGRPSVDKCPAFPISRFCGSPQPGNVSTACSASDFDLSMVEPALATGKSEQYGVLRRGAGPQFDRATERRRHLTCPRSSVVKGMRGLPTDRSSSALRGDPTSEWRTSLWSKGPQRYPGRQVRTRERLLREARRVFERLGYHATRVDDIVAAAGLAHGTFYRYFGSKEEVFRTVAAAAIQEIRAGQPTDAPTHYSPDGTTPDLIEYGMRTYLAEFRKDARMLELLEEAASYDPEVRQAGLDLRERMSRTTAHFIATLLARGEVDEDLDIEYVSVLIGAMVDRVAYIWFVFGRDFDEDRVIKQLRDAYLRMIGWHGSQRSKNTRPFPIHEIPLRGPQFEGLSAESGPTSHQV